MIYQRHLDGRVDLTDDFAAWGKIFLVFMGVSIVARIVIYIVFHIINAIATREEKIPVEDERDKMIKLKGTRNSYFVFAAGFVMGMIGLSLGMPVYYIFIVFVIGGLLSELTENVSQMIYRNRGV